MSVGRSTGRPARERGYGHPSSLDDPVAAGEVSHDLHVGDSRPASARRPRRRARRSCTSRTSQPNRAVLDQPLCLAVVDERVLAVPYASSGSSIASSSARDVRRVRHDQLERPGDALEQVRLDELDLEPDSPLHSRGRATAHRRERSVAVTRASGRSCFSASAIAPVPVPTSTMRGSPMSSSSARQRSTTISVSGRGTSARASVFSVSRRKSQSPST